MIGVALAFALAAGSPQEQVSPQDPIRLEDVIVEPRRLEDAAEAFVDAVAAPVPRRRMARWHRGVCVGVANLEPEIAQFIVDRVSDVARDVGLDAHEPPCHPSILIVATTDASSFTRDFVAQRPVLFRPGGAGMSLGTGALDAFITTDRPVRWWAVSLTVDPDTGDPAVRIPGQVNGAGAGDGSVMDYAPITYRHSSSRLSNPYRDDLKRMFVIVDVDKLQGVSLGQLADYIAMISLAQIQPDAETDQFETILNLFENPDFAPALTGWDKAYLAGLYESEWYRINTRSQVRAVSQAITREYRDASAKEADAQGE